MPRPTSIVFNVLGWLTLVSLGTGIIFALVIAASVAFELPADDGSSRYATGQYLTYKKYWVGNETFKEFTTEDNITCIYSSMGIDCDWKETTCPELKRLR